jgi:hypothetical protein
MVGGLVKLWYEKRKFKNEKTRDAVITSGILYSSGMIAGEGLVGILLAVFAIIKINGNYLADIMNLTNHGASFSSISPMVGNVASLVFFGLLVLTLLKFSIWNKHVYEEDENEAA